MRTFTRNLKLSAVALVAVLLATVFVATPANAAKATNDGHKHISAVQTADGKITVNWLPTLGVKYFLVKTSGNPEMTEALKTYNDCREKDASFVLEDPVATMALSRAEWRNGDARASLALLSNFDKRFRGHASIPQAYELAARVLVQGLNRRDMAQPILTTLEARYPESEHTSEVRWLLREIPQG